MDFDLSPSQKLLQDAARSFVARECPLTKVRELVESGAEFDSELWQGIADQGWIGLHLREELGGLDLTTVELAVVAEQLGQGCVPGPFLSTNWAASLLAAATNQQLATQLVPQLADGSRKASVAMLDESADWSQPTAGLTAQDTGGGVRLTGTKAMVMDGTAADLFVCVAEHNGGAGIVVVEAGATGVTITPTPGIDATRPLTEVRFDSVEVPASHVAASGPDAQTAIHHANQVAATIAAAELLGAAQWMMEATVDYAKTRKQFEKLIGSFQAVQHQCADMLLMTESSRSAVYFASWALSVNDPATDSAVAVAKAYCSDTGREVGNRAVQCHGGIGFTWEHDLQFFYRRAKAAEYLLGDAGHHREELAKLVLDA